MHMSQQVQGDIAGAAEAAASVAEVLRHRCRLSEERLEQVNEWADLHWLFNLLLRHLSEEQLKHAHELRACVMPVSAPGRQYFSQGLFFPSVRSLI